MSGDRKLMVINNAHIRPDAVVAKDSSGQHRTTAATLAAYSMNKARRYSGYVRALIYDEYIIVTNFNFKISATGNWVCENFKFKFNNRE